VTALFRRAALLAVFLAAGCAAQATFLERSLTLGNQVYRYRVWLPPHYTKVRRWPVILFLHGSGERGNDNYRQVTSGLGPALARFPNRYRAIVVFPQCRYGREWYGDMELQALAALEISHWGYVLALGRVVISTPAAELLARPDLGEVFLGQVATPAPARPSEAPTSEAMT